MDKEASSAEYYNNSILPITDNTNFYAVYSKKISLSYTTLGGSPIPATETETIYYNTGVKNPTNEARFTAGAAPTKEGVELEAWLLNNDESKSYKPGDIVAITENSKLYAKYKNRKYTITLNGTANGGLNPTKNIISCGYDEKFELNNYSASTNKSGYTFVGWSLEPNSKEIIKEYRVPAENTTLYAVFKKTLKANWLMYDTKAGMSNKPYTTCDIYNNEKTCYTQVGSMTMNPNYTAVGWSKTRGSTQVNAGIGLTTPITQDTDFYSITKITQDLVGTFYYYSNTNVSNVSTSCGLYNGATSCSISSPSNPSNYLSTAFNAWSNRNDGYTAASLNISANTNYYAYYRQITELNYNSGLFSNNVAATKSTETYTVEYIANTSGGWNSVPNATLKNPTSINDFNALGWREDTSMTIQEYDVNSQISMIKSYDLYAVYNRTLTLSYDLQGGTPARNNQTATQYYNSGAGKTTHSFTLAAAVSKTGYTFKNWKVDSLSGTAYNAGAQINIIEDSKMYANLEVNSYDVTINAESNGSVSSSSIKVNYGGTNTFTVTPNTGYYLESLSCTNGYTASGYTTGTSATGSQTVTISNNNNANDSSCSISFKRRVLFENGVCNASGCTLNKYNWEWGGKSSWDSNKNEWKKNFETSAIGPTFNIDVTNIDYIYISYKIFAGGSIDAYSTTTIFASVGSVTATDSIDKECIRKNDGVTDYCDNNTSEEERILELDVRNLQGEVNFSLQYSSDGSGKNKEWAYDNTGGINITKIHTS